MRPNTSIYWGCRLPACPDGDQWRNKVTATAWRRRGFRGRVARYRQGPEIWETIHVNELFGDILGDILREPWLKYMTFLNLSHEYCHEFNLFPHSSSFNGANGPMSSSFISHKIQGFPIYIYSHTYAHTTYVSFLSSLNHHKITWNHHWIPVLPMISPLNHH